MLENAKNALLKFHFGAPSCVPATSFETAGAVLDAVKVETLLKRADIFYLSEMMNYPGVLFKDSEVLAKIALAKKYNKPVDGHAPGLRGEDAANSIGGVARHNVYNALGAVALAAVAGLPLDGMRAGLREFRPTSRDNPGRLNLFHLGGATVIVDFAHNPHGVDAMVELARALPARRRLAVLGQAGDRDDAAIRQLARSAWALGPDRVILKEMPAYLRGRPPGEVTALLADELRRQGAASELVDITGSEWADIHAPLAWARPGDLLLLLTHAQRGRVLDLLERLEQSGWIPGTPLPDPTGQE